MSKIEQTLSIIKPDAVERNLDGQIKEMFKTNGFTIVQEKKIQIEKQEAEKFSGCTVHFVNSKLDSGKIIIQKKVKINKKDDPNTLSKKILKQEHLLYPKALKKILSKT